ncbi:MAG: hypothetical protein FWF24_05730 [Alphaproteobacteria bacterium]|nr:hypothetical protein [Alphaproteobacteria bacterium]
MKPLVCGRSLCVDNAERAQRFLDYYAEEVFADLPVFRDGLKEASINPFYYSKGVTMVWGVDNCFSFTVFNGGAAWTWCDLAVKHDGRGRGLGKALVKGMLGIMNPVQPEAIRIVGVTEAGFGFWPALGAVVQRPRRALGHAIESHVLTHKNYYKDHEKSEMMELSRLAQDNPVTVSRLLAQKDMPSPFLREIFLGSHFWIFPGEKTTRRILEHYLGEIPTFPPPRDASVLQQLEKAAHLSPNGTGARQRLFRKGREVCAGLCRAVI